MKTDTLIRALAADAKVDHGPALFLVGGLVAAFGLCLGLLWLLLGIRADLDQAMTNPLSIMRFLLSGSLMLVAGRLCMVVARPEGARLAQLWPLTGIAAATLGALIWAGYFTPTEAWQMAIVGKTAVNCLIAIPLLSLIPVALILVALRQGATTVPGLAACLAGLCGGGLAAMVYALHCTEDSPLFYVTWYGLAIAVVTLITTFLGARLLRW